MSRRTVQKWIPVKDRLPKETITTQNMVKWWGTLLKANLEQKPRVVASLGFAQSQQLAIASSKLRKCVASR